MEASQAWNTQAVHEGAEVPRDVWGPTERLTLRCPDARSLNSLLSALHASDLVSISLSFQTATFHYPPPCLPPAAPQPTPSPPALLAHPPHYLLTL